MQGRVCLEGLRIVHNLASLTDAGWKPGVAVGLITRRSQVQILPRNQCLKSLASGFVCGPVPEGKKKLERIEGALVVLRFIIPASWLIATR